MLHLTRKKEGCLGYKPQAQICSRKLQIILYYDSKEAGVDIHDDMMWRTANGKS